MLRSRIKKNWPILVLELVVQANLAVELIINLEIRQFKFKLGKLRVDFRLIFFFIFEGREILILAFDSVRLIFFFKFRTFLRRAKYGCLNEEAGGGGRLRNGNT